MAQETSSSSWTDADERALRLTVLDLHRVLRCMEEREAPPDLSWQSIQGRATLAQELWRKVQEGCHAATYPDESMRAQDKERLVQLQHQVDKACRRAREIAAERRGNEVDLIQEIFFPNNQEQDGVVNEEKKDSAIRKDDDGAPVEEDETDDDANEQHRDTVAERTSAHVPMSTSQDVEELQKAQREQLEAEIAHMAARLKESTQAMNTTLRTQTEELGVMEDLATKNVEKVGNVADNVTEHNKKSWRATLATWTILFAVLGSFLFCMMTIRMVPKQRNKCLFFCATQKEVCNRMNDGSIVCVDSKGSPYVKKAAPVSRREAEEAKQREEECKRGSDGKCIAPLHTDLDEVKDDGEGADAAETFVCSQGECKAHQYEDELEDSGPEEGESNSEAHTNDAETADDHIVDVCNEEGECPAHFEDEVSESSSDGSERMERDSKDKEHREVLEQVVGTGSEANDSSTAKDGDHESNPHALQQDDQVEKDPAADANQSSGGARGEVLETTVHDEIDRDEDIPVQEPATMNEDIVQGHEPTLESRGEVDREVGFKPAEISTLYESFDEDDKYSTGEKADFSATDVRMAALMGQNERLKRYLQLKPQYISERDDNGWQLIHETAKAGQVGTMKLLLTDYNADINARAGLVNDGATPLYLAYMYGHDDSSEVVSFIKAHGGVSVAPGSDAPYKTVAEHTAEELQQYNLRDFHLAAAEGDDIQVAQYITARPDLLEHPDENGWLAIHEAVRYGHKITAQLLINGGTDINARTGNDHKGWSPLGLAVQLHGEENAITQLLRRLGAEIHLPEK